MHHEGACPQQQKEHPDHLGYRRARHTVVVGFGQQRQIGGKITAAVSPGDSDRSAPANKIRQVATAKASGTMDWIIVMVDS